MRSRLKTRVMCSLLILLWCCLVGLAWAEDKTTDAKQGSSVFDLGEVVVTGNADTISQVATVETVDREHLDLTNSTDVSQALETLPGVHVSVGSRNEAYLNVRGFNEKYVPIFYDGIPWYIPNDGYVDPSEIPTGNLSQVTLTKGAASVLYGPNTMGGVINIISMKPQKVFEGSYGAEANGRGYLGNLNLGSKVDRFYVTGGVSGLDYGDYRMSTGYSLKPANSGGWYEDGYKRDNSEKKGLSESLKAGFSPSEGHEYAVGFNHIRSDRELPTNIYKSESPKYWRFSDWEKTTYYVIGDSKITDQLSAKTRLYHDQYFNVLDNYNSTFTSRSWRSTYDDHTNGGSFVLRSDYIEKNTTSFSFHYKDDIHKEQSNIGALWKEYETKMYSYGLEDDMKVTENLGLVFGSSYDIQCPEYANGNHVRSDEEAWNLLGGVHYQFEDATKLHLSIAKKSRFPTLNELYSSYLGSAYPNPNLKKETAINYEAGVQRPLPWDSVADFTIFYYDVEDLITRTNIIAGSPPASYTYNDNISNSRFRGFELSAKTQGLALNTLEANYTYLDAEDRSKESASSHLKETPRHQLYISDLFKVTEWFSLFAKAEYNKKQWDQKRNNDWIELDDYWLVDAKAMVEFSKLATFEVGVRNLFDENYETSYGFPREGREAFCGIRGSF